MADSASATIRVYVKTRCFEKFPFPAATDAQQARIRGLAEQLDAHRKRQQAQHPKLALTDMYNVLEKLRAGEPLTAKDKAVHEQGLVSVLRELHDELDAAVCDAYGWPVTLTDEEILARLVALNAERAAEEAQGLIRWLRPEYQAPSDHASRFTQHALIQEDAPVYEVSLETRPLLPWPTRMAEQAQAVRAALVALGGPASAAQVAAAFTVRTAGSRRRAAGDAGHAGAGAGDGGWIHLRVAARSRFRNRKRLILPGRAWYNTRRMKELDDTECRSDGNENPGARNNL